MELKFLNTIELEFWSKVFRTFLEAKYGYDSAIEFADQATLQYRKRNWV